MVPVPPAAAIVVGVTVFGRMLPIQLAETGSHPEEQLTQPSAHACMF